MALESVVFLQDPFTNNHKEHYPFTNFTYPCIQQEDPKYGTLEKMIEQDHFTSSTSSSLDQVALPAGKPTPLRCWRRKRKRERKLTTEEDMEKKRMTHIEVERNRRKQMNDYFSILRSLMPQSYASRGDQASIVGGTINFVKKLEQLLQYLEAHKQMKTLKSFSKTSSTPFASFFTFPQYSSAPDPVDPDCPILTSDKLTNERKSTVADIEVSLVETYATIKILARRQPNQLKRLVAGFCSLELNILHLNLTSVDYMEMVLYSFSVKVEDECQLSNVNEIATAVHELIAKIQKETTMETSTLR